MNITTKFKFHRITEILEKFFRTKLCESQRTDKHMSDSNRVLFGLSGYGTLKTKNPD